MDSTKVEIISKSLDKLVEQGNNRPSIWNVLIPVLIGAGLTLAAQFIIERWKSKQALRKDIADKKIRIISGTEANVYLLNRIIDTLAMYKVHKQYYIRASVIETDPIIKEDSFKKHYEKGQEQRETELKLDEKIADYIGLVTEYTILTGEKDNFELYKNQIYNYVHPKSGKFLNCNTEAELTTELDVQQKELVVQYLSLKDIFKKIQLELK